MNIIPNTWNAQTRRHNNAPDGATPRELRFARLASGSMAIVTAEGAVTDIIKPEDIGQF